MSDANPVWEYLKRCAPPHGAAFSTSLLGRVPYVRDDAHEYTSIIPKELQVAASKHGLTITGADYQRSVYILRARTE